MEQLGRLGRLTHYLDNSFRENGALCNPKIKNPLVDIDPDEVDCAVCVNKLYKKKILICPYSHLKPKYPGARLCHYCEQRIEKKKKPPKNKGLRKGF